MASGIELMVTKMKDLALHVSIRLGDPIPGKAGAPRNQLTADFQQKCATVLTRPVPKLGSVVQNIASSDKNRSMADVCRRKIFLHDWRAGVPRFQHQQPLSGPSAEDAAVARRL